MRRFRKILYGGMCVLLLGMLTACGVAEAPEVPDVTITEVPTMAPTETPKPTNTPTPTATITPTPTPDLSQKTIMEEAEKYGFTFGGPVNGANILNGTYKDFIKNEFNSITATNEMKAYSLLDRTASQNNPDGMPVMNYATADRIVEYAQSIGTLDFIISPSWCLMGSRQSLMRRLIGTNYN